MNKFIKLNKTIVKCSKCSRLVKFRKKISKFKRKQYINEKYWGKPITGFGDINSRILIVGLAPAAHGGTRTGRVLQEISWFSHKCLTKQRFWTKDSKSLDDGLKLNNAFITTALKCVPPGDKPKKNELDNCSKYFDEEINNLNNLRVIVALGKIAFDACVYFYKKKYTLNQKLNFGHGLIYNLPNNVKLIGCYHPSPKM